MGASSRLCQSRSHTLYRVKHIFTLAGGHISPILVACEASGIRVVDTRHEVTAMFAADAVARLSGIPGVVAVTAGPGMFYDVSLWAP
jgi:acetolactate synthase-like protein